jgi:hypothetical protein
MKNPYRIGVVGYSNPHFDKLKAILFLTDAFSKISILRADGQDIEIVSGLTDLGIPSIAYRLAGILGWRTAGVACKLAEKYECFECDRVQIEGTDWGDESELFLSQLDAIVRVGGGRQSFAEMAIAKERGILYIEADL